MDMQPMAQTSMAGLAPGASMPTHGLAQSLIKWSWSCRTVDQHQNYRTLTGGAPRIGDIALVRVESIGYHGTLDIADRSRLRLYVGDVIVGVFGNRYATAAFEAEVQGLDEIHMLTSAALLGTVRSRHHSMSAPTRLSFVGYLDGERGRRLNLKDLHAHRLLPRAAPEDRRPPPLLLVVGTAMDSGKTTAVTKLVKQLVDDGMRVAACKLTGSVSPRDCSEWRAAGATHVRDFSDYGFPSTYLCAEQELLTLFQAMVADASLVDPAVIVMEIADGVLQRETRILTESPLVRRRASGVILTAGCPGSALYGLQELHQRQHQVVAISGVLTSSPLFIRELECQTTVPVAPSKGTGAMLAELAAQHLGLGQEPKYQLL